MATKSVNSATTSSRKLFKESPSQKPFTRMNYYLMGGCVALIVIGFLLMAGPGSTIEGGFNPDIFSFRRIVLGPTLAFLGFLLMAFAIVWNPRKKKEEDNNLSSENLSNKE